MKQKSLEALFIDVVYNLKEDIGQFAGCNSFFFEMKADGRVDGDVKVSITIGEHTWSAASTATGNSIAVVLEEFLRRKGYEKRHAPLCLPNVRDVSPQMDNTPLMNSDPTPEEDDYGAIPPEFEE